MADMVSATAFSKAVGVSQPTITEAIQQGRLPAYSKSGRRVSPGFRGPKFLKLDEARQSFEESRIRLDDSFLAKESAESAVPRRDLVSARTKTSNLQAALLQMRLARELGDVIPKGAATAAAESLGRAVATALKGIPGWETRRGAEWRPWGRFWAFAGQICGARQFHRGFDHG